MDDITLKRTYDKFCGYWPLFDPNRDTKMSTLVHILPKSQDKAHEDDPRPFKFQQLKNGALSNISGVNIPDCAGCPSHEYCRPVRISHTNFYMSPSQQKKFDLFHEGIETQTKHPIYDHTMFMMFKNYVQERHGRTNSDLLKYSPDDFKGILRFSKWIVATRDLENKKWVSFALLDQHENNFCLEYVAYDMEYKKRSPGLATILMVANTLKETSPDGYLYLGSWSPGSPKTGYKKDFRGLEFFGPDGWQPLDRQMEPRQLPPPQIAHFLK